MIQTGKVLHFPVVLFDSTFWSPLLDWVRDRILPLGMVSPEDLELLTVTDDPQIAVQTVLDSYRVLFPDGASPHTARKADAQ
jgi:predicted Rossmann-fold nucleotide-binding protein